MTSVRTGIVAALLSAIALWLASPAVGVGPLAWVALVPVAFVVLRHRGGKGARIAAPLAYSVYLELLLIGALPFGIADGQWGDPPVPIMVGDSPILPVALLVVPLFGLLLYALRFGQPWGLERLPGAAGTLAAVVVPAFTWTALDVVRAKLDPGGLLGPLFASQADSPTAGLAALGGPWLLTFAIVVVNYALALPLARGWVPAARRPATLVRSGGVVVVLAAALVALLAAAPDREERGSLTVAAVQPGYDTAEEDRPELRYWEPGWYGLAGLDLVRDLSGPSAAAAARGAELIVWPEATFFVDPRRYPVVMRELREITETTGAALVVPFFERGPDTSASFVLLPGGERTPAQPKQRPMWFLGEHAPEGEGARVADAGAVQIASLLGVDTQDAATAREAAGAGATVITSSTHDWQQLAEAHQAFAALAARSSGLPLVRADWRYGSAIYDRDGSLVADAGPEQRRTVLVAEVSPGTASPYVKLGDAVAWVAVAATIAAWLAGARSGVVAWASPSPPRRRRAARGPAAG